MQPLPNNHLTLRLVRLNHSEVWKDVNEGLSFVLLKGGKGKYSLGTNALSLTPGDVMVVNPQVGGKLLVQNGEAVFWSFSIRLEHLLPLFSAEEICLLQNIAENFNRSKLYAASSPVAKECHRLAECAPPEGNIDHRGQLVRIAAAILSVEFLNATTQRSGFVRVEDHMLQVFESLAADELLTLSVGELADKFGCSRRHLNRLFHQHFGFSVAALRMEMRLLKAVSLLRDPDTKVISVAEQCGFNHLGLFNTCFKRRFGSSPGQWRKTASASPVAPTFTVNGSPIPKKPSNSVDSTAKTNDASDPIKAKVYEVLKKAYPAVAASPPLRGQSGQQGPPPNAAKSRPRETDSRYRPAA
jgi:AraC-like DNA-binding protein